MKHRFQKNNRYFIVCVYLFVTVLLCIISFSVISNWAATKALFGKVLKMLSPFIIGAFIAYLINPLVKVINYKVFKPLFKGKFKKFRDVASVLISYVIVIGAVSTVLFFIVPQILDSIGQVGQFVNSAQNGYAKIMNQLEAFESKHSGVDFSPIINILDSIPAKVGQLFSDSIPVILSTVYDTSMSLVSGILNFIIAIIVSIYMLLDKARLINGVKRIIYAMGGANKADVFILEVRKCNEIFSNFVIGKTIDSLIIGILCYILMKVTGLPYALVVSIIVGITNMIPYFGPFIGAIPGILLLLLVDVAYGLVFGILILALQQFDGLYLGPTILGGSTGIRPLWIIFAITVGGFIAGPLGMFLGVPIVAVIAYLFDKYIRNKLKAKEIEFVKDEETGIINRKITMIETKADEKVIEEKTE